ncbi:hypothetical protein CcaCcLH18_13781 [Colletotrichum camelliae]|nr:hypothetical protein CcaCcLH18_13781 [Colletotrichum camelliae]
MAHWIAISTIAASLAQTASGLYTDYRTRKAAAASPGQPQGTQPAPTVGKVNQADILPRTVHIPSNGFNAGVEYTKVYAGTAIVGVALLAMTVDQLGKLGRHLSGIKDELEVQTAALVQGWHGKGFGSFIYDFAKTEIDECGGDASVGKHAFYIYNPTTSADIIFKQRVEEQPLPSSFGGISDDIEAIFRLMWANRQTLQATMTKEEADEVVFHLLVPAKRTWAVLDRLMIDESVGRLIIKGHMDEGNCYTTFNIVQLHPQVSLHHVDRINTDKMMKDKEETAGLVTTTGGLGVIGSWCGGIVASVCFPPAVPLLAGAHVVAWTGVMVGGFAQETYTPSEPLRVLGPPHSEQP